MTNDEHETLHGQKFVPVCAIGASAGGVAALQSLLRKLPVDLGLAYVVILHLNPDEPSALDEILSVCTRMPVHQVTDGPPLKPNCVYVISPGLELVIDGDNVTARPFTEPRSHRAPIDMFFRSVAAGRGDGVAIILSGAGSDGALGVSAMKEAGGIIMVQEPAEAGFASMPQSAIATGMADFVAPVARLAERLVEVANSKEAVRSLDMDGAANDLRRIVSLLRAKTGHDFAAYKRATVMRRVVRRMQVCRTTTFADYADYLLTTPEEAQELFSDLLISVTMFFRDEASFEALARQAIRPIVETAMTEGDESIRVWVVGCATGEEAYSVALLLHEEIERQKATVAFQIFATDLDEGALATAREGRYPRTIEADVSAERLARFFTDEGSHYRVRKELRDCVLFAKHSILKEPPFMRLNLITCRNLLIYLERTLQVQVCSIFHYGLRPGQYLFLGSAETAEGAADLFAPIDRQARIYSSRPHAGQNLPILPQFAAPAQTISPTRSASMGTERAAIPAALHVKALENNAPASALVDDAQNILHLSPSAGRFILHSAGPVSSALPVVVRPELRLDLRLALARAFDQGKPTITLPTVVAFGRERRRVAMQIVPVPSEVQRTPQALVFFLEGGEVPDEEEGEVPPEASGDDVKRIYAELKVSQEALLASRSGHNSSIEELRAANEELQSINEEYRSTAEELETSKEELQSINEELHTVNAELKSKLETISAAHNDLQNLTAATEIGTLFLDPDLRIRMFTPPVVALFNITRHDIGRTITDFTHQLDYDSIEEDIRMVLRDLVPIEREVGSRRGQRYSMRLRPYRTVENRIDGTALTFVDVSERARAEAASHESEERYRALFESMDEAYAVVEVLKDEAGKWSDFRYIEVNPAFVEHTSMPWPVGKTAKELLGTPNPRWSQLYGHALDTDQPIRVEEDEPTLDRTFDLNIFALDRDRNRVAVLFTNITARKKAEVALRESEERYQALFAASPVPFIVVAPNAPDFTITAVNDAYVAATMSSRDALIGRKLLDVFIYDPTREGLQGSGLIARSIERVLETRRTDVMERLRYDIMKADGELEPHWWHAVNAPMFDADGNVIAIIHQATRVTDQFYAEQAARESEERQSFLLKLSDALRSLADPVSAQKEAMQLLVAQLGLVRAASYRVDLDQNVMSLIAGVDTDAVTWPDTMMMSEYGLDVSDTDRAGQIYCVADAELDPRLSDQGRTALLAAGIQSLAGVPLVKDGMLVFVLWVHSRKPRNWRGELRLLEDVAERVWAAMERSRAETVLREREASLAHELANTKALQGVSSLLIEGEGDEPLYRHILDAALAIMRSDCATLQIFDPESQELRLLSHRNLHPASAQAWDHVSARHRTICGRALREGRRVFTLDASRDEPEASEYFRLSGIVSVQSTPLLSRKGQLIGMISTHWRSAFNPDEQDYRSFDVLVRQIADAFDRARAEAALRESEERFRLIVESARDYAIFTIDQQGIVTSWPVGAANVFGWSEAEMLGQSVERIFVPEDVAAGAPEWERKTAAREGVAPDVRNHLHKDGRRIFIDGSVRPFTTDAQRPGFIKIGQDVTEQREAERALRESEERFRQFGAASSNILWIRNARTLQFEYVSPAFNTVYGLPREAVLQGNDLRRWLRLVEPAHRRSVVDGFKRVREGERVTHEFRIRRASDQALRWIRDTDFPLFDAEGRVERIGGLGHDITEEKETADRLAILVAELQHRTRNLMAVVRTTAKRTGETSADFADFRSRFDDRLEALARVQGLLSRLGETDRVAFDELIHTELKAMEGTADRVTLIGPSGIRLRSSMVQTLAMALHELATNAVKYGAFSQPNGHLAITWWMAKADRGDRPRLHIDWRESGVMMPPAGAMAQGGGQGRELIEKALPYQLNARTSFELGPDGVHCTIAIPVSENNLVEPADG